MRIQSDFAILDVKYGRKALAAAVEEGQTFKVKIEATIDGIWGQDDGVSREFTLKINKITEPERITRKPRGQVRLKPREGV